MVLGEMDVARVDRPEREGSIPVHDTTGTSSIQPAAVANSGGGGGEVRHNLVDDVPRTGVIGDLLGDAG